jgi:acid phosphatase family membrane protein YuiD
MRLEGGDTPNISSTVGLSILPATNSDINLSPAGSGLTKIIAMSLVNSGLAGYTPSVFNTYEVLTNATTSMSASGAISGSVTYVAVRFGRNVLLQMNQTNNVFLGANTITVGTLPSRFASNVDTYKTVISIDGGFDVFSLAIVKTDGTIVFYNGVGNNFTSTQAGFRACCLDYTTS